MGIGAQRGSISHDYVVLHGIISRRIEIRYFDNEIYTVEEGDIAFGVGLRRIVRTVEMGRNCNHPS